MLLRALLQILNKLPKDRQLCKLLALNGFSGTLGTVQHLQMFAGIDSLLVVDAVYYAQQKYTPSMLLNIATLIDYCNTRHRAAILFLQYELDVHVGAY